MNRRQQARFIAGRMCRIKAELAHKLEGTPVSDIPLFSHDATIQSLFNNGWNSVSATDIRVALLEQQSTNSTFQSVGMAARANIAKLLGRKAKVKTGEAHELV